MSVPNYGLSVFPAHQSLLAASAIDVEVARARGYVSVDRRVRLTRLGFTKEPIPGLLVPIRQFTEDPVTFQYRPDTPRVDGRSGKARKYVSPKDQPIVLDIHPMVADAVRDPSVPLFVTEGARKVDAAITAGCQAIMGLSGVWNWRNREEGVSRPLPAWSKIPLQGREVFVAFDADVISKPQVRKALNALAMFAEEGGAAKVGVVVLPDLGDGATGLDDFLAAGHSWDDVLALVEPWSTSGRPAGDFRPEQEVTNPAVLFDEMRTSLGTGSTSGVFLRGGELAHCPHISESGYRSLVRPNGTGDQDSEFQVSTLSPEQLAAHLDARLWCYRESVDKDGDVTRAPTLFPIAVATRLVAAPAELKGTRHLTGVVRAPFVRPDWSVCSQPGYDEATGMLYLPRSGLDLVRVPTEPSEEELVAAVKMIMTVTGEFPWVSDDDHATYIGMLLMPLLQLAAGGDRPLVVLNAHQPGSGKTLLATVARELFDGTVRGGFPSSEEEAEKTIHTLLTASTGSLIVFDNVTGTLRSSSLEAVLTTRVLDQRRLGSSSMARGINDRTWVVTANNASIAGDLARRCVWASIDPAVPAPEQRSGFTVPNLIEYVRLHRAEIVASLLTLVRAWAAHGARVTTTRSDSFGGIIDTINAILRHACVDGQMGSGRSNAAHSEHEEWQDFLHCVADAFGGYSRSNHFTARELLAKIEEISPFQQESAPALHEALPDQISARAWNNSRPLTPKSLSKFLRNREGRFFGDVRIQYIPDPKQAGHFYIEKFDVEGPPVGRTHGFAA